MDEESEEYLKKLLLGKKMFKQSIKIIQKKYN